MHRVSPNDHFTQPFASLFSSGSYSFRHCLLLQRSPNHCHSTELESRDSEASLRSDAPRKEAAILRQWIAVAGRIASTRRIRKIGGRFASSRASWCSYIRVWMSSRAGEHVPRVKAACGKCSRRLTDATHGAHLVWCD